MQSISNTWSYQPHAQIPSAQNHWSCLTMPMSVLTQFEAFNQDSGLSLTMMRAALPWLWFIKEVIS